MSTTVSTTSTPYDPSAEADSTIRARITLDPATGEAVFRAMDYPVWAIVLNLLGTNYDWDDVQQSFPELSRGDLEAALRFWQLHPDDIRDRVE